MIVHHAAGYFSSENCQNSKIKKFLSSINHRQSVMVSKIEIFSLQRAPLEILRIIYLHNFERSIEVRWQDVKISWNFYHLTLTVNIQSNDEKGSYSKFQGKDKTSIFKILADPATKKNFVKFSLSKLIQNSFFTKLHQLLNYFCATRN